MKKSMCVLALVAVIALVASLAIAAPGDGGGGIVGTKHDLSSTGGAAAWGDLTEQGGQNRICIYCHAPHNTLLPYDPANANYGYLPLWNHALTTNVDFNPYSNGPEEPTDPSGLNVNHYSYAEHNGGYPGGISKLCLSCHDGSVAPNAYGGNTGGTKFAAGEKHTIGFGGELSNHHPIAFLYADAAASDDEIANPDTELFTGVTIGEMLWEGKMECGTCHDVHNTKNDGEKFLWKSDDNSAFCLTCHLKAETKKSSL
jgi:predicted CXXCH cytochrome family protein